jgi:hypothetical protein
VRNTWRLCGAPAEALTFTLVTQPNFVQQRALKLLDTTTV